MNDSNGTSSQLFNMLSGLKTKKETVQKEYEGRITEIDAEIEAVSTKIRLLKTHEASPLESPKSAWIPASAFAGKSLREALIEMAKRNQGDLKVSEARKFLVEAGKLRNTRGSRAKIYTALSRSPGFKKVGRGKFRLEDTEPEFPF